MLSLCWGFILVFAIALTLERLVTFTCLFCKICSYSVLSSGKEKQSRVKAWAAQVVGFSAFHSFWTGRGLGLFQKSTWHLPSLMSNGNLSSNFLGLIPLSFCFAWQWCPCRYRHALSSIIRAQRKGDVLLYLFCINKMARRVPGSRESHYVWLSVKMWSRKGMYLLGCPRYLQHYYFSRHYSLKCSTWKVCICRKREEDEVCTAFVCYERHTL